LALSLSFGSTEELFGSIENKRKDEQNNLRFRTNLAPPGTTNTAKAETKTHWKTTNPLLSLV